MEDKYYIELKDKALKVEIYDIEENCMRDVQRHYVIIFKKFFKLAS